MKTPKKTTLSARQIKKLQDEVLELKALIHTVQAGEIDSLVVKNKAGVDSIFTLEGEELPYRMLIENLSEGALTIGSNGKILHCNKKFATMVNDTIKNIIGSSFFNYIATEQHRKLRHLLSAEGNTNFQSEFILLVKDDTAKVALLSSNIMSFGNVEGLSIVVTDITILSNEYKKLIDTQEKLIKQETLFRRLTENINDVFWVMSSKVDKIIYISPGYEKVWGRPIQNLYSNAMEWMECIVEEDKKKVLAFLDKLRGKEFAYESYRIIRPNGEEKNIFVKGYQNKDKHGKVIDVFGIASDITELTSKTNQLHLNDKLTMVGILAAGVAHEINNPISWIRGNLSYIKHNASKLDSIELNELMDESIEGVDRIIDIVVNLKGFSRNNDDELSLIDLHSILDSALKIASSEIKLHATLEKKYAENLSPVRANSGKMQQVFLNLIMNAIQSMNNDSMQNNILGIITTQEASRIRIDVTDTGSGIHPAHLLKMFDPFFTTKEANQGTGLGLSITHEIIKTHGGDITVKSIVGQGTTFTVYLPIGIPTDSNK